MCGSSLEAGKLKKQVELPSHGAWDLVKALLMKGKVSSGAGIYWPIIPKWGDRQVCLITCWAKTNAPTRYMRNMNKTLVAGVLVVCQAFAAGTVFPQQAPANSAAPISLPPLTPGEPAPLGVRLRPPSPLETIFLVTNHTANTVVASLSDVEVKSGSNWITQLELRGQPLLLSATNSIRMPGTRNPFAPGLTTTHLEPHQAAYSTIQFSGLPTAGGPQRGSLVGCAMNYLAGQPTGTVWRLTVSVQEKLTGLADASARLTHYPSTQARLAGAGVTNAPRNPFSGAYSYFGKPTAVSSEEVRSQ